MNHLLIIPESSMCGCYAAGVKPAECLLIYSVDDFPLQHCRVRIQMCNLLMPVIVCGERPLCLDGACYSPQVASMACETPLHHWDEQLEASAPQ